MRSLALLGIVLTLMAPANSLQSFPKKTLAGASTKISYNTPREWRLNLLSA